MPLINYKLATTEDFDAFFKIKCDPENIKWSGFSQAPDKNRLYGWYLKILQSDKRTIYLVEFDAVIVGFFYLDKIDSERYVAASSGILKEYCNLGIGTKTIVWRENLAREKGGKIIETWVSELNLYSYKRLIKNGWLKTSCYEIKDIPLAGGAQKFYKWEKSLN